MLGSLWADGVLSGNDLSTVPWHDRTQGTGTGEFGMTTAEQVERVQTEAFERALTTKIANLEDVLDLLCEHLADVRDDRDRWRTMAEASQRLLAPPERTPWWRRLAG
jgi:hypothetical protein